MTFAKGDRVKATRYGETVYGTVEKHDSSIVFVRFDGSRFTHWMHPVSLTKMEAA